MAKFLRGRRFTRLRSRISLGGSPGQNEKPYELTRPCSELRPCCLFPKVLMVASRSCSLCSFFPPPSWPLFLQNLQICHFLNVVSFLAQVLECNATTMVRPANHLLASHHTSTQQLLALFRLQVSYNSLGTAVSSGLLFCQMVSLPASLLLPGYSFS